MCNATEKMRVAVFVLTAIMFSACIHKRVHKRFRQYSPYKVNDVLIFQNTSSSKLDTLFVTTAKDFPQGDGPAPHLINRHTFVCCAYTSDFKNYINLNPREWTQLIEIVPDYTPGPVRRFTNGIYFNVDTKSFKLYRFVPFDTLHVKHLQTLTVNGRIYTDVYEIDNLDESESGLKGNVKKFYWSKENGYLKFITDINEEVLLVQKTNDAKILDFIRQSEKYKDENWRR